jgi:hypothetical protein
MANLPRLKPDPIPPVHPVPEFLAEGELKARYEDMKAVLRVPWMGVVTMSFAHHRAFYDALWQGARPLCASHDFTEACQRFRHLVEEKVSALEPPPLRQRLAQIGYAEPELQGRYPTTATCAARRCAWRLKGARRKAKFYRSCASSSGCCLTSRQTSLSFVLNCDSRFLCGARRPKRAGDRDQRTSAQYSSSCFLRRLYPASAMRVTAGALGFRTFTQSAQRPAIRLQTNAFEPHAAGAAYTSAPLVAAPSALTWRFYDEDSKRPRPQ